MSLDSLMAAGQDIAQQGLDLAGQALDNLAGFAGLNGAPTPAWRLTLNGKPLDSALRRRLVALTLTDNRGFDADQLDIVLDDSDGMLELPGRGAVIAVALGWQHSGLIDKGSYTVDEVEHSGTPDILTLRARSTDLREGIAAKREKSWSKTTLGAIVSAIAAANQLQPAIPDWLAKRRVEQLDQRNESDAQLLHRLAREHDAVATVKNGRLVFCKAGDAETVSGKPFPVCTITRASGDGHRFNIADRNAYTAVKAQWQDLNRAKRGEVIVDKNTRFERRATVTKLGRKTKRKKLTAIQQKGVEPSASNVKVLRHIYASEASALQGAKAAWEKLQRGAAEFSINLAYGRPELFAELPAKVQGFKPAIDATDWVINKITHTLNDGGYTCQLELEMKLEAVEDPAPSGTTPR
ncbi:phage late control D family protein [Chromobacterium haemolyticum]|uniref:phage late control D family protein n=1 Tax=Chromobacterium haemolyticum TaxID=394935 RepID=UPI001FFE79D8|nr:phage late control D family protein [Chromobacterium haemolyticum]